MNYDIVLPGVMFGSALCLFRLINEVCVFRRFAASTESVLKRVMSSGDIGEKFFCNGRIWAAGFPMYARIYAEGIVIYPKRLFGRRFVIERKDIVEIEKSREFWSDVIIIRHGSELVRSPLLFYFSINQLSIITSLVQWNRQYRGSGEPESD